MNRLVITYADAASRISSGLADRTVFTIVPSPNLIVELPDRLDRLPPGWIAYIDKGTNEILIVEDTSVLTLISLLTYLGSKMAVVISVPKTTPATVLSEVLGSPVAPDGSQDLIIIQDSNSAPIYWSNLFVDALALVDSSAAAQIRTMSIQNQN